MTSTATSDGASRRGDENLAPPVTRGRKQAATGPASGPTATTASDSTASTSSSSRVANAGLMLQKLNHLIRCFAPDGSESAAPNGPTSSAEGGGQGQSSSDNNNNNSESTGPQTRNRNRAEKLKSRWMNMVLSSPPGKNGAQNGHDQHTGLDIVLPPAPAVRDVPTPIFPEGHSPEVEFIVENEYLSNNAGTSSSNKARKVEKRMTCECTFTPEMAAEGRLGCTSPTECFNRMLYVECGSRCSAGDYCANKRFQRREYASLELFDAGPKGLGVRAEAPIEPGDFLLEYVGEVIDFEQFRGRLKRYSKAGRKHWFFMALSSEQYLDATLKGNLSRYINHACDPNSEMQKWTVNGQVRIGFYARRRIEPGEEVTLDYQFETYGEKVQTCLCGSVNCRGYIGKLVAPAGTLNDQPDSSDEEQSARDSGGNDRLVAPRVRISSDRKAVELGEKIDKLSASDLRSSGGLLDLCRLMVRAESRDHRTALISLLRKLVEASHTSPTSKQHNHNHNHHHTSSFNIDQFTGDFIRLHGLDVLWSWLVDDERSSPRNDTIPSSCCSFSLEILQLLDAIPMPNRNVLDDSQLWSVIERLAAAETEQTEVKSLASSLVAKWANLKQLFRIPRMVVSQSSRVQSVFNKQKHDKASPISQSGGSSGSVWATSMANSRFSRSLIVHRTSHYSQNGHNNSNNSSNNFHGSKYHWQNPSYQSQNGGSTADNGNNNCLSKEERRKQFEQTMREEEKQRRQQLEEEARRCSSSANYLAAASAEDNSVSSFSPNGATPSGSGNSVDLANNSQSRLPVNKEEEDEEEDAEFTVIAEMMAENGLDLATVFNEISQLVADPLMADLDATRIGSSEADSEQLIARLSSFPQITTLISLLSSDIDVIGSSIDIDIDSNNNNQVSEQAVEEKVDEPSLAPLPAGWSSAVDQKSGRTYYYNRASNKTQWDRPVCSPSSVSGKKRVSLTNPDETVDAKKRKRTRPCEVHNVFDDCSPYLDGESSKNSAENSECSSPSNSNRPSSSDKSFRHDLGKYISKLLKPYYYKEQAGEDGEAKALIKSSDEFKDICRKWTDSIYKKERAQTRHRLELCEAIQNKVQSFVDKNVETMRRKQHQNRHH